MKSIILSIAVAVVCVNTAAAQELYVNSEPASNIPAKAISAKYAGKLLRATHSDRLETRHMAEFQAGINKNLMVKASTTFSDMYTSGMRWESVRGYAKYRFLSLDEVHKHFRMAAFAEAAYSRNPVFYDELSLDGDQSGVKGGVILTQLWHKFALSSTLSYLNVLTEKPDFMPKGYPYQAFNYSLSGGYLLFPRKYTSYKQTNFNLYAELLGQQTLDKKSFYVDFAPALQLIFNSSTKLNMGYRFQLNGDMHRMADKSWQLSIEKTFLNALKKKPKKA